MIMKKNMKFEEAINSLEDIVKKLEYYEDKLNLCSNKNKIKELIKDLDSDLKDKIEELI